MSHTVFPNGDIVPLKGIFNICQQHECIEILRSLFFLEERELLEIVVDFSPKKFYKFSIDLALCNIDPKTTFQWGLRFILER